MSIAALCDHRVVLHRAVVERDELQDVVEIWGELAAPAGLNARPDQSWSGTLQDAGPGEGQAAMRRWFLVAGFDARERDVMEVLSGPEAPGLWRIESVTRPTNPMTVHHVEVNVSRYDGAVREEAVTS